MRKVSPKLLAMLGLPLILSGSFGTAYAALRSESNPYTTRIETSHIYCKLLEEDLNGKITKREGKDTLLKDLQKLNDNNEFNVGQTYSKKLYIQNDSDIPEYVRAIIYRYWTDETGKRVDVDPSLIEIDIPDNAWNIDKSASTTERTILWRKDALNANETSEPFTTSIRINPKVSSEYLKYKGLTFHVEAQADAVQTHSAQNAMNSAWGYAYDVN